MDASDRSGSVRVRGYTRKDGTYVQPHYRSAPDGNRNNNWSTKGNVNPYTGKPGTKSPDPASSVSPASASPAPAAPQTATSPALQAESEGEKDGAQARVFRWQLERAQNGSAAAAYEVGLRYLSGDGVTPDQDKGREWLARAAKNGVPEAYQKLKNTDFAVGMRDADGRIVQSTTARSEFMRNTGHPSGRPGYVITHVVPLDKGGGDTADNLQWQKLQDALPKETWK